MNRAQLSPNKKEKKKRKEKMRKKKKNSTRLISLTPQAQQYLRSTPT